MVIHEGTQVRHAAEAGLLQRAIEGDLQAANDILRYLSSANPGLRCIMLETLHDSTGADAWKRLLCCLAVQRWDDKQDCERRLDPVASQRIDQSIVDLFVEDEHEWEKPVKELVLRDGLEDQDSHIRQAAAYLLALRGDPGVIPLLSEMIDGGEAIWQLRAIEALAAIKDERSGPPLIKALAMGHDLLHHEARWALGELGSLAVPAWLQALSHPDAHIRWHAARGLGEVGDARSVQLLAEGLCDENQPVRWVSARVLARLDAAAVPAILTVLSRQKLNEPFRQAAYHALHSMLSRRTQERIKPVLEALRSPAASVEAPAAAQRLLASW